MKEVAVITGGSSGLGFEIAKALVKKDIDICIIGREQQKLIKAEEKLNAISNEVEVMAYRMDIGDEDTVLDFYKYLKKEDIHIKYLFNNAGKGVFGPADAITMDQIQQVIEASMIGMALMTTNALKAVDNNKIDIINIMSTAGVRGKINESIYCMAKWGARGFTEALQATYKGTNIHVTGIYPGGMNTPFWDGLEPPGDVTQYLDPEAVANQIVTTIVDQVDVYVQEMIIEKP